jgi:hypothetical protein
MGYSAIRPSDRCVTAAGMTPAVSISSVLHGVLRCVADAMTPEARRMVLAI